MDKGDFYTLHVGGTSGLEISPAAPGTTRPPLSASA
jgi:hypothetical protein